MVQPEDGALPEDSTLSHDSGFWKMQVPPPVGLYRTPVHSDEEVLPPLHNLVHSPGLTFPVLPTEGPGG